MALTAEQAAAQAEKYFKDQYPSIAEGKGMFANIPMGSPANTEEQTEKKQPSWLKPTGAATGAVIAAKDLGTGLFNPSPNLFRPITVQPKPLLTTAQKYLIENPYSNPTLEAEIRDLETRSQAPRAGLPAANAPTEGGLPVETSPVIEDAHVQQRTRANEIAEIADQLQAQANEKANPTGERTHNAETNRIRLETDLNLAKPGAPQAIIGAGSMRWDPKTQAYMPITVANERITQSAEQEWEAKKKAADELQAKKQADAAADTARVKAESDAKIEKERLDAEHKQQQEEAKRELKEKQAELTQKAKKHELEVHEAEEQFKKKSEAEAARKGKALGDLRGGLNLASGIVGGMEAFKNFNDALKEYQKKNDFSDEMIDHFIQGTANLAMAVPKPITQLGGNAVAFYQEMKKNGLSDQAISHALMGAGAGAMMRPTPANIIGGALTAGAGMAYPYAAQGVRYLDKKIKEKVDNAVTPYEKMYEKMKKNGFSDQIIWHFLTPQYLGQ